MTSTARSSVVFAVCILVALTSTAVTSALSVPQGSAAATYGSSSSSSAASHNLLKPIKSVRQLHNAYGDIFLTRNRNAASHLWISHVLARAPVMTRDEVERALTGFCAVSGSPVTPHDYNRRGTTRGLGGNTGGTHVDAQQIENKTFCRERVC
jgi:hypothetical protein